MTSLGTMIVEFAQMITKGSRFLEHLVSLEGDPNSQRPTDFIYQFSHYLKRSFGLVLCAEMTSNESFLILAQNRTSLFGYVTRECWTHRLNMRFTMASYPENFFSAHSPRYTTTFCSRTFCLN